MRPAAIAFVLLLLPTAARAEAWDVVCPTEARGSVELQRNDGAWVATPQSSAVTGRAVESIGGQPALVCIYRSSAATTESGAARRRRCRTARCRTGASSARTEPAAARRAHRASARKVNHVRHQ